MIVSMQLRWAIFCLLAVSRAAKLPSAEKAWAISSVSSEHLLMASRITSIPPASVISCMLSFSLASWVRRAQPRFTTRTFSGCLPICSRMDVMGVSSKSKAVSESSTLGPRLACRWIWGSSGMCGRCGAWASLPMTLVLLVRIGEWRSE